MSNANMAVEKKSKGTGCLRWLGRIALGGLVLVLVLITGGAIYQAVASAQDAKTYKPVDQMVDVNGIQMRLDCRGIGSPTVVLEAGGQSSSSFWVRIQDDVVKFTRVCSYDRAGYGWSDTLPETLYPPQVAEMLHDLLEKGREGPPYLMVGHSFGGIYIRTFTAAYPGEVVGMVLVDSSHDAQNQRVLLPPEIKTEMERIGNQGMASVRILQITAPLGVLRAFGLLDAGVGSMFTEVEKGPVLAEVYRSGYIGAWLRETEMMSAYAGRPEKLGDLPLIVLSQKIDAQDMYEQYHPLLPELFTMEMAQQLADSSNEMQDELAALSTHGKRIVVEDTGHFIQLDVPQVVIDAIWEVFGQIAR